MNLRYLSRNDLEGLPKKVRANLINALVGPRPAILVGTQDLKGQTNLSIVSSCLHMGSAPPLLGILIRPRARPRHTLENILATGEYTLNHIHPEFLSQAHQTSAHYPREISEFQATGLKALYREGISAPFVLDSRVQISMKLREHLPIALNGTELVIGEVTGIWALHSALDLQEGLIQLTETQSVAVGGLDQYYGLERLSRFQYAKPELPPRTK